MVKGRRSFFNLLPRILPNPAGGFGSPIDQTIIYIRRFLDSTGSHCTSFLNYTALIASRRPGQSSLLINVRPVAHRRNRNDISESALHNKAHPLSQMILV